MADILSDGNIKVYAVPTIVDIAAPTVAECNAGIKLQDKITADGFIGFKPDTADVDTSALDATFNTAKPGRASFSGMMLRLKKQDGTDTIYNTLIRNYTFYVVVRQSSDSDDAWASTNKVRVYPVTCGEVAHIDPEPNTLERYEVPLKPSSEPNLRAVVA
jgi:hypothetical protein